MRAAHPALSDPCWSRFSTRTHKTAIAFQISRQHWGDQIRHRLLLPVCLGICDCIILKPSMKVGWNDNRKLDEGSVWSLANLDRRHCCSAKIDTTSYRSRGCQYG